MYLGDGMPLSVSYRMPPGWASASRLMFFLFNLSLPVLNPFPTQMVITGLLADVHQKAHGDRSSEMVEFWVYFEGRGG